MDMVKTSGFVEISSSLNRKIVWHYAKNTCNVQIYQEFLRSLEPELKKILKTRVQQGPIKFNLKPEATYNRPNVANSLKNRAFKTSATDILIDIKLMTETEEYKSRGSGFTLESIDG